MKKALLVGLVLLSVVSCNKETPVEKSISNYVQTSFQDPSSYERISIAVLDTVTVAKKIKMIEDSGLTHKYFENEPKDKFLYYTVSHKYRANNSFGALMINDDIVSMDKDLKIIGSHSVQ
jgi:hypothetical protein